MVIFRYGCPIPMSQLKKFKGEQLKTAIYYLAVLQTNIGLMTVCLEDELEDMDEEYDGDGKILVNEISDEVNGYRS